MLALLAWPSLFLLVTGTQPTLGPRWLFFFLVVLAVTGTALPFVWVLHRRFDGDLPAAESVLLRQALLVGLYAALSLWLQINRALSLPLALLLALGLAVMEGLLRLLERSTWRPGR